jgi:hypothetical protein
MCRIVLHLYCLSASVSGNWYALLRRNRKAAILCSIGVIGIRANICFSSCGFCVNLYLEAIVHCMEQKIQGVDKGVRLKPHTEGQTGVYSIGVR